MRSPSRPGGRASSTEAAGKTGDEGIGAAVKEFEALEDLLGRIASYAGLTYFSDTTDPANGKLYGDVQAKITDISAHLLFFSLGTEQDRRCDIWRSAWSAMRSPPTTAPGSRTCARTSRTSSTTAPSSSSSKNP